MKFDQARVAIQIALSPLLDTLNLTIVWENTEIPPQVDKWARVQLINGESHPLSLGADNARVMGLILVSFFVSPRAGNADVTKWVDLLTPLNYQQIVIGSSLITFGQWSISGNGVSDGQWVQWQATCPFERDAYLT